MARPRYEEMRSTISLTLSPEGRRVWDAADTTHRDAWINWVREPWRRKACERRLDTLLRCAAAGNLDFARPVHMPATDYGSGAL